MQIHGRCNVLVQVEYILQQLLLEDRLRTLFPPRYDTPFQRDGRCTVPIHVQYVSAQPSFVFLLVVCLSQSFPGIELRGGQAYLQVVELLSVAKVADSDAASERGLSLSVALFNHEGKRMGGRSKFQEE